MLIFKVCRLSIGINATGDLVLVLCQHVWDILLSFTASNKTLSKPTLRTEVIPCFFSSALSRFPTSISCCFSLASVAMCRAAVCNFPFNLATIFVSLVPLSGYRESESGSRLLSSCSPRSCSLLSCSSSSCSCCIISSFYIKRKSKGYTKQHASGLHFYTTDRKKVNYLLISS